MAWNWKAVIVAIALFAAAAQAMAEEVAAANKEESATKLFGTLGDKGVTRLRIGLMSFKSKKLLECNIVDLVCTFGNDSNCDSKHKTCYCDYKNEICRPFEDETPISCLGVPNWSCIDPPHFCPPDDCFCDHDLSICRDWNFF